VNGQSRGRISHARCARDDADADADAMGRCDGTARRGDETRATRASVVACERERDATVRQDASRPCSSTTTTTVAGPADAHHTRTSRIDATRGTRARASHRIASHPSIHRFDACVTSTRREVRARARTCECVKKVARAARIARGASARGGVGTGVDSSMSRCRRCVDVVAGFIHSRDARDVVRACAMGGRDDEPVYDAAFARGRRVDVADARRARHGTARHGTARGCARPQTPTSAVV